VLATIKADKLGFEIDELFKEGKSIKSANVSGLISLPT